MLVANIINPVPLDYRAAFPNTSFPDTGPGAEFLQSQGFAPVQAFQAHDARTQRLVPCAPFYADGWVYTVEVVDKTAEELEADYRSEASRQRRHRNQLLVESDWTQLADAPVDAAAWASYRQQLRDITDQADFPWNIDWPAPPG